MLRVWAAVMNGPAWHVQDEISAALAMTASCAEEENAQLAALNGALVRAPVPFHACMYPVPYPEDARDAPGPQKRERSHAFKPSPP